MAYNLVFRESALRQPQQLSRHVVPKIVAVIDDLVDDPRPTNCKKLTGVDSTYRIRIGDYRVLYTSDDTVVTIEVVKIANRKQAYE